MAPPQGILFPPEKICMEWQHRRGVGAGLYNLGSTCFLNSILQCLTYTPPLANHLLSREHGQSCDQHGFCMMCLMEEHVCRALLSSVKAIQPRAVSNALTRIGEHFEHSRQEDAHEFLRCAVDAMQKACLSGSSHLDIPSQCTTIIHQIFGGFLRSRVTCLSCRAVFDSLEPFQDVPLDIKAASSVGAALQDFVTPEQLDGANSFKCHRCDKLVAATKRLTVHCAPRVLTLCLKRFDALRGRKISKVVEYPETLDLGPYSSQSDREPLLYSLYAVLVHSGGSCRDGHYFCYTKASDGLWYKMDDSSVKLHGSTPPLKQEAYLLFYIRCSDSTAGEAAASSPASAQSFHKQAGGSSPCHTNGARKRPRSRSPQSGNNLPGCFMDTTDRSAGKRRRTGPLSHDRAPKGDAAPGPSKGSSLLAPAPRAAQDPVLPRKRERARTMLCRRDLDRRSGESQDSQRSVKRKRSCSPPPCEQAPGDDAAPGPSDTSSGWAPAPRAAREPALSRQRQRSRSPQQDYNLCSRCVDTAVCDHSAGKRRRTGPLNHGHGPRDDAAPGRSDTSSGRAPAPRAARKPALPRQRQRSRSPQRGL